MKAGETGFSKGFDADRYTGGKQAIIVAHGCTMAELCQVHTADAVQLLANIVNNVDDKGNPKLKGYASASRIKASIALLDRAWGKPESIIKLREVPQDPKQLQSLPTERLMQLIDYALQQDAESTQD